MEVLKYRDLIKIHYVTACSVHSNTSCEVCLKNVSCLWCNSDKKCIDYPVRTILPPRSLCELPSARWGVCWVDFQALIIAMSVILGALLLAVLICCCCCCRKKKVRGPDKTEEKIIRQNEQRKIRQEERKTEMKVRHDEIRNKYGEYPNKCGSFVFTKRLSPLSKCALQLSD
ncbi:Pituitary tumor-transforming gene 1 protein-interacting protein [Acipenser ruthenus]|uniref:Pituitary tumor-transforming gene 1 protein-interacting protein n=1 Tax=Acipenser ruthenus TaxID=7906 RepID=A0A662YVG1_ACIRT|nr:Pituitary tumor-transforming gene 1 protein-interacting protein [Acipenser ruthenus]